MIRLTTSDVDALNVTSNAIRCNLTSIIVAFGVRQDVNVSQLFAQAIGVGANDCNYQAVYNSNASSFEDIDSTFIIDNINCIRMYTYLNMQIYAFCCLIWIFSRHSYAYIL